MSDKENNPKYRIALFIDIENLLSGASTIGLPLDVAPILRELKAYGNVQVRKCFGDILKCMKSVGKEHETNSVRNMLHYNLVHIEDVPYITAYKNSADIRLVIDALSLAYQYDDMTHFAIVASDRDYVPLFNKLHELGRTVIAVGIDKKNTNPMLIEASDYLFYYEAFFPTTKNEKESDEEDEDAKALLDSYFHVLHQAIRILENSGRKVTGSAVAITIRQLRSDFSPELVNLIGFKEFIEKAAEKKIVEVEYPEGPGDILISKPSTTNLPKGNIVLPQPEFGATSRTLMEHYREILEDSLRIPLPSREDRKTILATLYDSYEDLILSGSFDLMTLSETSFQSIPKTSKRTITSSAVYKISLSLYFGRCFHCEQGYSKHNPTIVGLAASEDCWERKLNEAFIRTINFRSRGDRIVAKPMSALLFESEDEKYVNMVEEMIGEVCGS